MGRSMEEDPLTLAMAPPPDESPEQRRARELLEAEAQRISDEIDEQIRKERDAKRKKKRPVKVLLLGQSESGKTATLKNFQLTYSKREFAEERAAWRAVIQLNLVRNVIFILDILSQEMSANSSPPLNSDSDDDSGDDHTRIRTVPKSRPSGPKLKFSEKHRLLKLRLAPLQRVKTDLERYLGPGSTEPDSTNVTTAAPFEMVSNNRRALQEFSINSTNGWKSALDKFRSLRSARPEADPNAARKKDAEDEVTEVIASCKDDMKAIWEDSIIREMLSRRKSRIEDSPGFFLNDSDRIAVRTYQPTDDDVVRARLRTVGVQEYRFVFDHGRTVGQTWHMFDVGGTRSSRAAWYPYFDDVDAIIFLAPISCFDEKLAEDRRVNRLEDSYLLWRSAKLMRGVRIRDHVPSFGERRNDLQTATRYFQQHFKEISKQYSPVPRPFYVHLTSVIDTKSTAATLGAVEESILRDHLRRADLM